jgi:hypothetical protein
MEQIFEFQRNFWDERANLPIVNPVKLPCSHYLSEKHLKLLVSKEINTCPRSVIRNGELTSCRKEFEPTTISVSLDTAKLIEEFINRNSSYYERNYNQFVIKSNYLYEKQITIFTAIKNPKKLVKSELKEKSENNLKRAAVTAKLMVIATILLSFLYQYIYSDPKNPR